MPLDRLVLILVVVIAAAMATVWIGATVMAAAVLPAWAGLALIPAALGLAALARVVLDRLRDPEAARYDRTPR